MFDQNQNFEEPEDLKEIDEAPEDLDSDSADFTEASPEKEETVAMPRSATAKGLVARKMLEEYREELALRKAIYDDLYGFDEDE